MPKLLLHGRPGVVVTPDVLAWARATVRGLMIQDVGDHAGHFLPEDRPEDVARALVHWVGTLD